MPQLRIGLPNPAFHLHLVANALDCAHSNIPSRNLTSDLAALAAVPVAALAAFPVSAVLAVLEGFLSVASLLIRRRRLKTLALFNTGTWTLTAKMIFTCKSGTEN